MHGLVSTGILYAIGVLIYFCATYFLSIQATKVVWQAAQLSGSYTNTLELKERYNVLKQRQALKYAALDCWKIAAENLPDGLQLHEPVSATARNSPSAASARRIKSRWFPIRQILRLGSQGHLGRPAMFEPAPLEPLLWNQNGNAVSWHFTLQLKNVEKQKP